MSKKNDDINATDIHILILKLADNCSNIKQKKEFYTMASYIQELGEVFGMISSKSQDLKLRYTGDDGMFPCRSSKQGKYLYEGVTVGTNELENDLYCTLALVIDNYDNFEDFSAWLTTFLSDYRFPEKISQEYGACALEKLIIIKQRLFEIAGKKNVKALTIAQEEIWL